MTQHKHYFNLQGVCTRCGGTRADIVASDAPCTKPAATVPAKREQQALARDRPLAQPLTIASHKEGAVLEARLVSADAPGTVVAAVRGTPGAFDPDAAFRELDDLRSQAESAYQWILDCLGEEGGVDASPEEAETSPAREAAPAPTKPGETGRILLAVIPGLLALAYVFFGPAGVVLVIAQWVAAIVGIVLVLASFAGGCLPGIAAFIGIIIALTIVRETGVEVGASRVFLALLVALIMLALLPFDPPPAPAEKPDADALPEPAEPDPAVAEGPVEYVIREGEASRYVPGLYLVGERQALAVAIECRDEADTLLRRVVLPLAAATRETAAEAVRISRLPDEEYAAERARVAAEEEAARAAMERLSDLERSRRELQE